MLVVIAMAKLLKAVKTVAFNPSPELDIQRGVYDPGVHEH